MTSRDCQPPRAVLFDLDGVIFDSRQTNIIFYNHMLELVGLPPEAERHVEVIHRESMEVSLRHLMGGDTPQYRRALKLWATLDYRPFLAALKLFPGVAATLATLAGRTSLAVITNRGRTSLEALARCEIRDYFRLVVTPQDLGVAKPDPRLMAHALERLGVTLDQAVYVGDSSVDEAFSQQSGVRLVAFQNPRLAAWAHLEDFPGLPGLLGLA